MRLKQICAATAILGVLTASALANDIQLTDKQLLGKRLFNDTNLSSPAGQVCGSCHAGVGMVDPDSQFPTSEGILPGRFGPRNAPTVTYLATAPDFQFDTTRNAFVGGQFLDGRALNLTELAKQPFVNPIEMHSPNRELVVLKIRKAEYAPLFRQVFGPNSLKDLDTAYDLMADAIADFIKSPELNRFDSKFDYFLDGEVEFTDQELQGFQLFQAKNCIACHVITPNAQGGHPVFTRFGYANVGPPRNPRNLFYTDVSNINPAGLDFVDQGLGGFLLSIGDSRFASQIGKFNFPTLRNIAVTAPYFHNGVFDTVKEVVHFVNTRDVPGSGFGPPEVPQNVSGAVGNLGLTDEQEDAIVAFLETLTDGYQP